MTDVESSTRTVDELFSLLVSIDRVNGKRLYKLIDEVERLRRDVEEISKCLQDMPEIN